MLFAFISYIKLWNVKYKGKMYEWRSDLYYVKYVAYILQIYSNDLCVAQQFVSLRILMPGYQRYFNEMQIHENFTAKWKKLKMKLEAVLVIDQ